MDLAQDLGKLLNMARFDLTSQQLLLPVHVGLSDGCHCQDMLLRIFKDQFGNAPWRSQ